MPHIRLTHTGTPPSLRLSRRDTTAMAHSGAQNPAPITAILRMDRPIHQDILEAPLLVHHLAPDLEVHLTAKHFPVKRQTASNKTNSL